jgi:hypothetical protein
MTLDEVISELIAAQDWASIRDIVEENLDALSSREADDKLRELAAQLRQRDTRDSAVRVDALRALISDAGRRGVGRAFVALVPETPALVGIAITYCFAAATWEELREVVRRYADSLLAPYMDARLAAAERESAADSSAEPKTTELRKLLASCREHGIDVAFRGRSGKVPFTTPLPRALVEFSVVRRVIRVLLEAKSSSEWIRIVRAHSDIALSDTAEGYLAALVANAEEDRQEDLRLLLQREQMRLLRCRLKGVEATVAEVRQGR